MKINKINWQHRRDFYADWECEGCGNIEKNVPGYDDDNFHRNVIPNRTCKECGKSSNDLGVDYRPLTPKYKPHEIV